MKVAIALYDKHRAVTKIWLKNIAGLQSFDSNQLPHKTAYYHLALEFDRNPPVVGCYPDLHFGVLTFFEHAPDVF